MTENPPRTHEDAHQGDARAKVGANTTPVIPGPQNGNPAADLEQVIAQAITRGTHYQRRADQTYRQAQARAVIAALAAHLGAAP